MDNYKNVLSGQDFSYKDAQGNEIVRQGSNLSAAFLNSVAVAVPATIIPILIAAFAAYGFAWMNFPGRKFFFTVVVALLVVPLQLALVPILQDYTKLNLNGTYLAMWLAHTGFGLPLAIYLMFNYICHHSAGYSGIGLHRRRLQFHHLHPAGPAAFGSGTGFLCHFPVPVGLERLPGCPGLPGRPKPRGHGCAGSHGR